ncbi:MAG: CCA tRNA nucleotidyltransferase [Candidatus Micrarchaeota archaeon]|nr:CCA tRNA nucleotidyltransferase [Candidatus Micrarchaeota archaeon]
MQTVAERKAAAVFRSAIRRIEPSAREMAESFSAAKLAGSLANGTNLSGGNEFDIFLLFPRHYSHHDMTMNGLSYARRAFAGMRMESRYAEHPYLQVFSGKFHADIVPAYKIESIEQRGSSVDRSQLHTEYVNSKLDEKGKTDVRLLKRFMKNFGIYGAELRVEGFSGYLCELLVIVYGSLYMLMREASKWNNPAIDMEKHLKYGEARKKFASPLVVIDPTDPTRNVAAVVAQTSLSRFVFECRRFLASPSEKFFFSEKNVRSAKAIAGAIAERKTRCLLLCFDAPKVVPDVLWPQLKKTTHALYARLEELDFSVFGSYYWSDGKECAVLFELDRWELPSVKKSPGPQIRFASDMEAFVSKHKNSLNLHLEHDRIVAVDRREFVDAEVALHHATRNQAGIGLPQTMGKMVSKSKIIEGTGMVRAKYAEFLSDYFFMRIA